MNDEPYEIMFNGQPMTITPFKHPPRPSWDNQHQFERPSGWIQWKGTTVCADIHCDCGASYHIDAEFAYYVRCPACKSIFAINGHIQLLKIEGIELAEFGSTHVIEPDDDDIWAMQKEEESGDDSVEGYHLINGGAAMSSQSPDTVIDTDMSKDT